MKTPASTSVGIREFRAALADYIDADTPVTVTRHGQAVGLFVPLRRPSATEVQGLQEASARFRAKMPLEEAEIDQIVADFDALRRRRPPSER
jgi:antitoxin (DNA-binding transcriptional repressor) of toxin-antitoxin stability system